MKNWKEKFEKKFRNNDLAFPYLKNSYSAFRGKTLFKEIITFIAQVEQEGIKEGLERALKLRKELEEQDMFLGGDFGYDLREYEYRLQQEILQLNK